MWTIFGSTELFLVPLVQTRVFHEGSDFLWNEKTKTKKLKTDEPEPRPRRQRSDECGKTKDDQKDTESNPKYAPHRRSL